MFAKLIILIILFFLSMAGMFIISSANREKPRKLYTILFYILLVIAIGIFIGGLVILK